MRALDEDALFCDFWEYYGIHGFDSVSLEEQAILAAGLPAGSRSMRSISKSKYSLDTLVLVSILDQLRVLNWKMSKDAKKKRNFPASVLDELLHGEEKNKKDELMIFSSGEEFKKRWAKIVNEAGENG